MNVPRTARVPARRPTKAERKKHIIAVRAEQAAGLEHSGTRRWFGRLLRGGMSKREALKLATERENERRKLMAGRQ